MPDTICTCWRAQYEAAAFCYSKLRRCSVQEQIVNFALQLCTERDFKHADSFPRIIFTSLPIIAD